MSQDIFDLCPALILVLPAASSDQDKFACASLVGKAIIANKPIFLVATHGAKVSDNLAKVTDRFFEMSAVGSLEEWEAELRKVQISVVAAMREMGLVESSCSCDACNAARQLDVEQDNDGE